MSGKTSKVMEPFVSSWKGQQQISSADFLVAFEKYDKDKNGYIDGSEIHCFLEDLLAERNMEQADIKALKEFKEELMIKYDANNDRRIELAELSCILPAEDNFLLQFRMHCSNLTSVDFMTIWKHYDSDCSGYLETKEIKAFCYDLLNKKKTRRINPKAVTEFSAGIVELYDKNKDGKIEIRELQKLLPVEKNYLLHIYKEQKPLNENDFNMIFKHYDQNGDGNISEAELEALMRDLIIKAGKTDSHEGLQKLQKDVMKHVDKNKDGKIQRKELSILFTNQKIQKILQ